MNSLQKWCYTEVDSNGLGIPGKWGFCSPDCSGNQTFYFDLILCNFIIGTIGKRLFYNSRIYNHNYYSRPYDDNYNAIIGIINDDGTNNDDIND